MVANPPRQHPHCIKKNITCLGDTLSKHLQLHSVNVSKDFKLFLEFVCLLSLFFFHILSTPFHRACELGKHCVLLNCVIAFQYYFSVSNEQVWEAHLCYVLAGEQFGFPFEEKTKMSLIGVDHR